MTEKARIRIELDTAPAQAKLRELVKESEAAAEKLNESLGKGAGRAAALGAVAGAGFGLAQRAASRASGFVPDVISEATAGFRAGVDSYFGGPDARAASYAREQTKAAFAEIVGRQQTPEVGAEVRNFYNNVRSLREVTERGQSRIDQEFGGNVIQDAFEGLKSAITGGFERIVDALPLGGK